MGLVLTKYISILDPVGRKKLGWRMSEISWALLENISKILKELISEEGLKLRGCQKSMD